MKRVTMPCDPGCLFSLLWELKEEKEKGEFEGSVCLVFGELYIPAYDALAIHDVLYTFMDVLELHIEVIMTTTAYTLPAFMCIPAERRTVAPNALMLFEPIRHFFYGTVSEMVIASEQRELVTERLLGILSAASNIETEVLKGLFDKKDHMTAEAAVAGGVFGGYLNG